MFQTIVFYVKITATHLVTKSVSSEVFSESGRGDTQESHTEFFHYATEAIFKHTAR